MPQDSQVGHEVKLAAAARLAGGGMDQLSIAKRLGCSQASVSRMLNEAVERGWLTRSVVYHPELVTPDVNEEAERLINRHDLLPDFRKRYGSLPLRRVVVFDSGSSSVDPASMRLRLRRWGRAAATRIDQLLRHCDTVGVSWGATLFHSIRGLTGIFTEPPRRSHPVNFVPLCCEPLGDASVQVSSSHLTKQLNELINGGAGDSYSFTGVPACIPPLFDTREKKTIERLFRLVASYAAVFPPRWLEPAAEESGQGYLIDRLQLVLTSLGPAERMLGYPQDRLIKPGFQRADLQRVSIGDICGTVIPRPGLSAADRKIVEDFNSAWTGVRWEQLSKVPPVTERGHDGGIVVLAIGASKVDIVLRAVEMGVHELLIDEDLAQALRQKLSGRRPRPTPSSSR